MTDTSTSTKSINKRLKKYRWLRLKFLFVCFFKLSGKNDRNEWLRKKNVFGLFGQGSNYQPYDLPRNPKLIRIHDNVRIAAGVAFYEHDGINAVFAKISGTKDPKWHVHETCIEIFDNCFIGGKSVLIGNLKIGPNSIVAGGSVVTKDVQPGEIVAGNPAKVVGNFFELMEKRKKIDYDQLNMSQEERINQLWGIFSEIKRK